MLAGIDCFFETERKSVLEVAKNYDDQFCAACSNYDTCRSIKECDQIQHGVMPEVYVIVAENDKGHKMPNRDDLKST